MPRVVLRRAGAAVVAAAVLAGGACTPPPPPTPARAARSGVATVDPPVEAVLERSCYPCHSAERHDPWYAKLAPSSWSIAGGKEALDFSTWPSLDDARRRLAIAMVADSVHRGSMPPVDYAFLNHAARLDDADRRAIQTWAEAQPR
jgi:hypothetical protein